jgi:hypothetical protein
MPPARDPRQPGFLPHRESRAPKTFQDWPMSAPCAGAPQQRGPQPIPQGVRQLLKRPCEAETVDRFGDRPAVYYYWATFEPDGSRHMERPGRGAEALGLRWAMAGSGGGPLCQPPPRARIDRKGAGLGCRRRQQRERKRRTDRRAWHSPARPASPASPTSLEE